MNNAIRRGAGRKGAGCWTHASAVPPRTSRGCPFLAVVVKGDERLRGQAAFFKVTEQVVAHMENKIEWHLVLGPFCCVLMSPLLWFLAKALISGYSCRNLSSNFGRVTLSIRVPSHRSHILETSGPKL